MNLNHQFSQIHPVLIDIVPKYVELEVVYDIINHFWDLSPDLYPVLTSMFRYMRLSDRRWLHPPEIDLGR